MLICWFANTVIVRMLYNAPPHHHHQKNKMKIKVKVRNYLTRNTLPEVCRQNLTEHHVQILTDSLYGATDAYQSVLLMFSALPWKYMILWSQATDSLQMLLSWTRLQSSENVVKYSDMYQHTDCCRSPATNLLFTWTLLVGDPLPQEEGRRRANKH